MTIHKKVSIGHVHLTVASLDRALKFYRDLLGFEITMRYGESAVFLSAGGYHHHIGLNTWAGPNASPPPINSTGLYHVAILFPNRQELAKTLKNIIDNNYPIDGSADHGVSEAIYLRDPDNNGIELYVDRPKKDWKVSSDGQVEMVTEALDINDLLSTIK